MFWFVELSNCRIVEFAIRHLQWARSKNCPWILQELLDNSGGILRKTLQNVKVRVCECHYFSELLRVYNIICTFAVWEVKSEALR